MSIAELLEEVKKIWAKLDKGRCEPDLEAVGVVDELSKMLGLPPRDRNLTDYIESCRIVKNSRAA